MLLHLGQRSFALGPDHVNIIDLLQEPTAQACLLPTGRILYFALPIPKNVIKRLSPDSLRQLHCHLEGNRNLLYSIGGQGGSDLVSAVLEEIEDELLIRNDGIDPEPIRMPICTQDLIEHESIGTQVYNDMRHGINDGLRSAPPEPYTDFPPRSARSIDLDRSRYGSDIEHSMLPIPLEDRVFRPRKINSLSPLEMDLYFQGDIDVIYFPMFEDWVCIPGPTHSSRNQYAACGDFFDGPDCRQPSFDPFPRAPSETLPLKNKGQTPRSSSDVPAVVADDAKEVLYPFHDSERNTGSSTPLQAKSPSRTTMGTRTSAESTVDDVMMMAHQPLFAPWTEYVARLAAFTSTVHPAEVGLLCIGDLHIVPDNSQERFRLATRIEPEEETLNRSEWYSLLNDYKSEIGYDDEKVFGAYLDHLELSELPYLYWKLLAEGHTCRRTCYLLTRGVRKIPGRRADTDMTGQEWRRRFFAKTANDSYASWRETLTDEKLDAFYWKIAEGRRRHEDDPAVDRDRPCPSCDCYFGEESPYDDGSESVASENQDYEDLALTQQTREENGEIRGPCSNARNFLLEYIQSLRIYDQYLRMIGLCLTESERVALFGGSPFADVLFEWLRSDCPWPTPRCTRMFNQHVCDWLYRIMMDLKPSLPVPLLPCDRQRGVFLTGISKIQKFLYCRGCLEIISGLGESGEVFYMKTTASLSNLNNTIRNYERIAGVRTVTALDDKDKDLWRNLEDTWVDCKMALSEAEFRHVKSNGMSVRWDDERGEFRIFNDSYKNVNLKVDDQEASQLDETQLTQPSTACSREDSLQAFIETLSDDELEALCEGLLKAEQDGSDLGWRLVTAHWDNCGSSELDSDKSCPLVSAQRPQDQTREKGETFVKTLTKSQLNLVKTGHALISPKSSDVMLDDKKSSSSKRKGKQPALQHAFQTSPKFEPGVPAPLNSFAGPASSSHLHRWGEDKKSSVSKRPGEQPASQFSAHTFSELGEPFSHGRHHWSTCTSCTLHSPTASSLASPQAYRREFSADWGNARALDSTRDSFGPSHRCRQLASGFAGWSPRNGNFRG